MTEDDLKRYYAIYTDLWKLFRKNASPTDDEEFWSNLEKECYNLCEQHGNSSFVKQEVVNLQLEIERIWKDGKGISV
ncbi:MAG: hypothetical protein ACRC3H_13230 [Lachnospiraceae bacterium]